MTDKVLDKMEDNFKKIKSIDEIDKGPELEDIEIKITLTSTGYRIDPPLDSGFLQSVLEGIIKDLFIQEIFSRDDAPFMRRIERPKRK